MEILTPKLLRITKTCILYLCFLFLGMCVAVPGPSLLDLQNIVQTDTQHIAFIYTARSVGYLAGCLIGGIVFDIVKNKQFSLAVCNLMTTASVLGIPWSRSLGTLTGLMVVNGATGGAVDTCGNVYCLNLWGKESGPFYQALHFTFGLGCLIAPLVAAPFLSDFNTEDFSVLNQSYVQNNQTLHGFLNMNQTGMDTSITSSVPLITYPFTIIGCFGFVATLLFFVVTFISPNEDKKDQDEDNKTTERSLSFIALLVVLCALLLFVETGTEIGFAQMLTSYAVKGKLKLSTTTGSYMTSAFWASFTISRLTSVFLATKFSNLTLLVYDIIITSVGAVLLLVLSNYEWALWLSSALLGTGIASFFPATIGWLDTYINVTNKIASFFVVGAAFGEMLIPFTISYYMEQVPEVLPYVVAASCFFSGIILLLLYLILRRTEPKYVSKDTDCKNQNSTTVVT